MKWALGVTLAAGIVMLSGIRALYGQVKSPKGTRIATMPAMESMRRVPPSPVVRPPSWNDVEQEFEGRRRQRKEWGVGYEFVEGYYAKLARPESTGAKTLEEHLDHLARWRQEMPNSVAARLVTARALLDYAWEARGVGVAATVTTEGWKLFDERVADAQRLVDRAIALGVEDRKSTRLNSSH